MVCARTYNVEGRVFGFRKTQGQRAIALDAPCTPGPQVCIAERDGRAILMDLRSGSYFGLDDVGTRVWELLAKGRTPVEIFATVEAEYDVPADRLRADATRFLKTLIELRLVQQ